MKRCIWIWLLACALLTACNPLSSDLPLLHVAPSQLATPRTVQQRLTMQWPNDSRSLDVVLDIDAEQMQIIAGALGMRLFSLRYDGQTVTESDSVPMLLPVERMVNDVLLIYAPAHTLTSALPEGWRIQDTTGKRQVWRQGELVVEVIYNSPDPWQGQALLHHQLLGYSLTIDSSTEQ